MLGSPNHKCIQSSPYIKERGTPRAAEQRNIFGKVVKIILVSIIYRFHYLRNISPGEAFLGFLNCSCTIQEGSIQNLFISGAKLLKVWGSNIFGGARVPKFFWRKERLITENMYYKGKNNYQNVLYIYIYEPQCDLFFYLKTFGGINYHTGLIFLPSHHFTHHINEHVKWGPYVKFRGTKVSVKKDLIIEERYVPEICTRKIEKNNFHIWATKKQKHFGLHRGPGDLQ